MNILPLISFDSLFHFESGWRTRTLGDARGTKHHLLLEGFINDKMLELLQNYYKRGLDIIPQLRFINNEKTDNLIITNHCNILIHFYIHYYNYY